jgi:hypothetical protein
MPDFLATGPNSVPAGELTPYRVVSGDPVRAPVCRRDYNPAL